jgi:hypothetical protein
VVRARSGTSLNVGGSDCAVSDERLVEVLRFYLGNPGRRTTLDTGPEYLALPVTAIMP